VAIALIVRDRVRLGTAERVFLAALAGLAVCIALSSAWSVAPAQSVLEFERVLVYVAVVSAVLLLSCGRSGRHVLGGLLAAISVIAIFSLLTRLVPDRMASTIEQPSTDSRSRSVTGAGWESLPELAR
jgi:hypothetical protein